MKTLEMKTTERTEERTIGIWPSLQSAGGHADSNFSPYRLCWTKAQEQRLYKILPNRGLLTGGRKSGSDRRGQRRSFFQRNAPHPVLRENEQMIAMWRSHGWNSVGDNHRLIHNSLPPPHPRLGDFGDRLNCNLVNWFSLALWEQVWNYKSGRLSRCQLSLDTRSSGTSKGQRQYWTLTFCCCHSLIMELSALQMRCGMMTRAHLKVFDSVWKEFVRKGNGLSQNDSESHTCRLFICLCCFCSVIVPTIQPTISPYFFQFLVCLTWEAAHSAGESRLFVQQPTYLRIYMLFLSKIKAD